MKDKRPSKRRKDKTIRDKAMEQMRALRESVDPLVLDRVRDAIIQKDEQHDRQELLINRKKNRATVMKFIALNKGNKKLLERLDYMLNELE